MNVWRNVFRSSGIMIVFMVLLAGITMGQSNEESPTSEDLLADGYKRYNVESGTIEYTMSGSQTGQRTIHFDRWGLREAEYENTVTSIMGMETATNQMKLLDGTLQYTVNLDNNTGTRIENPMIITMAENSGTKNLTELGSQMLEQMGGEKIGTETILGKECDVYHMASLNTKTWNWNGIMLKTETNMFGISIVVEATNFQTDIDIAEDKFAIADDVTITQGPNLNSNGGGMPFNFGK